MDATQQQEAAKQASLQFVLSMADPALCDRDAAWAGVAALFAAAAPYAINQEGADKFIARVKRLTS